MSSIKSYFTDNKNKIWKYFRLTCFQNPQFSIRSNPLQVCSSVFSFLLAVLFIPSCQVLSRYFYVSLNLVAVPAIWSLINSVTQLLGLSYWNDLLWFLTVTVECWKGPRSVSIPIEALLKRLSSVFFRVILFFSWLLLPLFCFCVDDYIFSFVVRFEIVRF